MSFQHLEDILHYAFYKTTFFLHKCCKEDPEEILQEKSDFAAKNLPDF